MNAELLRKTATLLRSQEEEKSSLSNKLDEVQKEATVTRTVLNMLKDGLLDVDEIDTKIAEFNTNKDLLSKTADYFDRKTTSAGTVKDAELPGGMAPEDMFLASLQS
jgi:hypothetical protein